MPTTTNYGWTYNLPNTAQDTWGGDLNNTQIAIDAQVKTNENLANSKAPKASPTFTGTVTGPTFVGNLTGDVTGNVTGNVTGAVTGNATSADKWSTARTVTLTGVVTGSIAFDGTDDFTLATSVGTIADDTLTIAQTSGLQAALDSKVAHASGNGRTITVGNTAPSSPLTDDIWFDTTA